MIDLTMDDSAGFAPDVHRVMRPLPWRRESVGGWLGITGGGLHHRARQFWRQFKFFWSSRPMIFRRGRRRGRGRRATYGATSRVTPQGSRDEPVNRKHAGNEKTPEDTVAAANHEPEHKGGHAGSHKTRGGSRGGHVASSSAVFFCSSLSHSNLGHISLAHERFSGRGGGLERVEQSGIFQPMLSADVPEVPRSNQQVLAEAE